MRGTYMVSILASVVVGGVGGVAAADPVDDLNLALGDWAERADKLVTQPLTFDVKYTPTKCFAVIDDAKRAGIAGSQRVRAYRFKSHPKAQEANGSYEITVDEARSYCDTYKRHFAFATEWQTFEYAKGILRGYSNATSITDDQVKGLHAKADECRAAWDRAQKAGVPSDLFTSLDYAPTFGELRVKLCDAVQKVADDLANGVSEGTKKIREKYAAEGVTGDKLELLVKYDSVYWRLPGGNRTDDPKKLAAATVLFQWLEAEDRDDPRYTIHTIRKYKFKGGTIIGPTEKTYRRRKGADIGKVFK